MFEQDLDRYWKTVVSTIRDGIMIVDPSGTIVSVNEAMETITGYSRGDLVGQKCSMLNCSIYALAHGNGGCHWCSLFRDGELNLRRCTLMRKDGRHIHALKHASILNDSKGEVIGAVETITDITEIIEKENQIQAFRRELKSKDGFNGLIGVSATMVRVFDLIKNAAQSDAPVFIFGESGTGKELVSRAVHDAGRRRRKPFVKVNCAALTESLLESELFGHVKGAFTGAYRSRKGRFETAQGGDIFLDEIGDLPLSTQVKLLRVLEEKVIERVGDGASIPVDVRIISATNRDLKGLVEKGLFRKDLYFRINVIPIQLPPLRERREDIPLMAESFFHQIRLKSGKEIKGISNAAMEFLMAYHWPGNVRELKSAFEYAFVTCQETMIEQHHLPPHISRDQQKRLLSGEGSRPSSREDQQKRQLLDALSRAAGNQSEAARLLGVSRVTVWNRMKKYDVHYEKKVQGSDVG